MSGLRFPQIKADPGVTRMSLEEFNRLNAAAPEPSEKKAKGPRNGKFNAIAVETEHGRFDSKMEYQRFLELQLMERAGVIQNLQRQVKYPLALGDTLVCTYIADFVYAENGTLVIEDSKGFRTREYLMKKNLMKKIHGIEIFETGIQKKKKSAKRRSPRG